MPRVAGRLESMPVKLGDRVAKGQHVAKIEDREIREQINQAEATLEVNKANVVAARERREGRSRTRSTRDEDAASSAGCCRKQLLEDAEARYNAAVSQVDVAKAQLVADAVAHRRAEDHALQHDRARRPSTASSAGAISTRARLPAPTP